MKSLLLGMGIFSLSILGAAPPRHIPDELLSQFTLNGQIPLYDVYLDDTYSASSPKFYSKKEIDKNILKVYRRETNSYEITDTWLYQILERHPIYEKEVAIIGSTVPWYESIVLAFGGYPTTIEYNPIQTDDKRLTILTVAEHEKNPKKFDVILSISSTEHDGLGRYGDPINPFGDLQFMSKVRGLLKKEGAMILAVPIGADALYWNAHRIYGQIRLPLLLKEWDILDSAGFDAANFHKENCVQPVFYLLPHL